MLAPIARARECSGEEGSQATPALRSEIRGLRLETADSFRISSPGRGRGPDRRPVQLESEGSSLETRVSSRTARSRDTSASHQLSPPVSNLATDASMLVSPYRPRSRPLSEIPNESELSVLRDRKSVV